MEERYTEPFVLVVYIESQGIICGSENVGMREVDFGDGGFTEQ